MLSHFILTIQCRDMMIIVIISDFKLVPKMLIYCNCKVIPQKASVSQTILHTKPTDVPVSPTSNGYRGSGDRTPILNGLLSA